MEKVVCEICFYQGNKTEFEDNGDYCIECVCDHAMCPKCKKPYHAAMITE